MSATTPHLSLQVLRHGVAAPPPTQVPLRAGPLALRYEGGDLRAITLGDTDVLLRVYAAVRDQNWGTVPPVITDEQIDAAADSFRISYTATHQQGPIDVRWRATITGDAQGTVTFRLDGQAHTTFQRNRIGFCVLHPMACAGARAVVQHVDGTRETARFPELVVAEQPVLPFAELAAIAHEVAPDLWAEVRFDGEIFEMEDQRNWTDASFKTFCTPLRLPYPVEVQQGTPIQQSVTLVIRDERQPAAQRYAAAQTDVSTPVALTLAAATVVGRVPQLGLGIAADRAPLTEREVALLRALNLAHLRADLRLDTPGWEALLHLAAEQARALGVALELAIVVPPDPDPVLAALRAALLRLDVPVAALLVFAAEQRVSDGALVGLARRALAEAVPRAVFAGGTDSDFVFLNQTRPDGAGMDAVCFALNPQVHAFDDASLVETLAAQTAPVRTAQTHFGLPVVVSPVTLLPRFNPYATAAPEEPPPGELPPTVDVRQMSLFGAAWTLGSLKYLAESGVVRATYYETSGWQGVIEREHGSPLPERFCSLPGAAFPLYHVLRDVGALADGEVLALQSSAPLRAVGFALRAAGQLRLLLASLSPAPQTVMLRGLSGSARLRVLDEAHVVRAMREPEAFAAEIGTAIDPGEPVMLELQPYAVARIDLEVPASD